MFRNVREIMVCTAVKWLHVFLSGLPLCFGWVRDMPPPLLVLCVSDSSFSYLLPRFIIFSVTD